MNVWDVFILVGMFLPVYLIMASIGNVLYRKRILNIILSFVGFLSLFMSIMHYVNINATKEIKPIIASFPILGVLYAGIITLNLILIPNEVLKDSLKVFFKNHRPKTLRRF